MKLALIQEKQNALYEFHSDGIAYTRDTALRFQDEMIFQNLELLRQAACMGADIAVTSEAINYPGVPRLIPGLEPAELVSARQNFLLSEVAALARASHMAIVLGMFRLEDDNNLYNEAVVFERDGTQAFSYRKNYLAGDEKEYLTPGEGFPLWETPYGKIGIGICWDMQFPETARFYARQGADLVLCPTWGWETPYAAARAYENGIYVASAMAVPSYKDIGGLRAPSQFIAPSGAILAEGNRSTPQVVMVDVDDIRDCAPYRTLRIGDLRAWEARSTPL